MMTTKWTQTCLLGSAASCAGRDDSGHLCSCAVVLLHACHTAHSPVHSYMQDVWFDSGTSWAGCLDADAALGLPADLYLEGSDQHRGWGAPLCSSMSSPANAIKM